MPQWLSFVIKLLPALRDSLWGGISFGSYLKKNKLITILLLSTIVSAASFLFMFEQAVMYGGKTKELQKKVRVLEKERNHYLSKIKKA